MSRTDRPLGCSTVASSRTPVVLQGTVNAVMHGLVPVAGTPIPTPTPGDLPSQPDSVGPFVTAARRDTTHVLAATLGEPRMRELRTQGEAMNEDQTCTYARTRIDAYRATCIEAHDG